jgi:hypothetical protein
MINLLNEKKVVMEKQIFKHNSKSTFLDREAGHRETSPHTDFSQLCSAFFGGLK